MSPRRAALILTSGATVALTAGVGVVTASTAGGGLPGALARAAAGSVGHTPPDQTNVRSWLGVWRTNFGRLEFSNPRLIHCEGDGCQFASGGTTEWKLSLRWSGAGSPDPGGSVDVEGQIDNRDYQSFQGFFGLTSGPSGQTEDVPVLIYRTGRRITGGYWKPCPLSATCTDHHPFRGMETAPAWVVGFRFTQKGPPEGQRVISTQTGGAGSLIYPSSPGPSSRADILGATVFHVDDVPGAPALHYTVTADSGEFIETHQGRVFNLDLSGPVTASNDPRCPAGPRSTLVILTREGGGLPNHISVRPTEGSGCNRPVETWQSTDSSRVSVHIERPHRLG